ncbi:MAG: universal stress protein [Syntrophobacteraceae bacterium]|nr:universal stress protein [Syntrophobacteraceae bacterium]
MDSSVRERILVASDGSQHSVQMIDYVSSILDPGRFEVVLYHVVTRVPESFIDFEGKVPAYHYELISVEQWEQKQREAITAFMEKARSILVNAGFSDEAVTVKVEDRKTGIVQDIVAESQNGYRALVLGRKGLSDLKDFMLGSVAEHLLGLVRIPLWVVGASSPPAKVLACLDGSDEAMRSLSHLADVLDGSANMEIKLFHAVRTFHSFRNFVREVFSSEADKDALERVHGELDRVASMMQPSFDKAREILTSRGLDPARIDQKIVRDVSNSAHAIMQEAEEGGYDTIVVGRRGLSRVEEFTMGRISRRVIHMAKNRTVWVVC